MSGTRIPVLPCFPTGARCSRPPLEGFAGIRALADASLEVRAGEIHALVGENGAGKSTLVRILTGALAPDSGEVIFDGHRGRDASRRLKRVGWASSRSISTRRSFLT